MNELNFNLDTLNEDIIIKEDSKLKYFLSKEKLDTSKKINITVEENVSLDFVMVDFSKQDLSLDLNIILQRGAKVEASLASVGFEDTTKIFHFNVEHSQSDSYSRVNMSGINTGNGVLKFLGNSLIISGAHRSDTRQEGKITNLSDACKSEVSPSLLIKDNDVQASHGAALGAYNADQLFYLMSRGLSSMEAKKLITFGTLLPMIEKLEDEKTISEARTYLEALDL